MKVANTRLQLDEHGSDVPLQGITPAEAVMLAVIHTPAVNDFPFGAFEDVRDAEINEIDEKRRLVMKYGRKAVEKCFPGAKPNFPVDFDEAKAIAMETSLGGDAGGADLLGAQEKFEAAVAAADAAKE